MVGTNGKPLKVLSTTLGAALLANVIFGTNAFATEVEYGGEEEPKLISWTTEEVKAYFDPVADWELPFSGISGEEEEGVNGAEEATGGATVSKPGSSFGWDDLLLYHMLFSVGRSYSSKKWHEHRPSFYSSSKAAYVPMSYTSDYFQNKKVVAPAVKGQTNGSSSKTGSTSAPAVKDRSTSSKPGGIGGKSSSMSSGKSSSSASSSSGGGFGG